MNHPGSERLVDYIRGALGPADDAAIHGHLATCAACRALHAEETALGEALRRAARAEERELPAMFKAQLWEAVRAEPSGRSALAAFFDRLRPAVAVPIAAAVIVAASLAYPISHAGGGDAGATIDVQYYLDAHKAEGGENPLAEHAFSVPTTASEPVSPNVEAFVSVGGDALDAVQ